MTAKRKQEQIDLGQAPNMNEDLPNEIGFDIVTQPNPVIDTNLFNVSAVCPAPIDYEVSGE
ncbi:MAG: hypothetical protein KIT26_12130 [Nitrosomonas sp.]|nr:hypothetical protein [Nitrosomonas sp.]